MVFFFFYCLRCSELIKYITWPWKILQEDNNHNAQVTIRIFAIIWTVHILYQFMISFQEKVAVHRRELWNGSSERWGKYTDPCESSVKDVYVVWQERGNTWRTLWALAGVVWHKHRTTTRQAPDQTRRTGILWSVCHCLSTFFPASERQRSSRGDDILSCGGIRGGRCAAYC